MSSLDGADPAVQPSPDISLPIDFNVYKPSNVSVAARKYTTRKGGIINALSFQNPSRMSISPRLQLS